MKPANPKRLRLAHQYLYYVKGCKIWGDDDYDRFCQAHGLQGEGGSDRAEDYDFTIKLLADDMARHPKRYPAPGEVN